MTKITMKVEGMMCGMCEAHVCDAIRKVCDGKPKITASHSTGLVEIILDTPPDVARMKNAVKGTGYKVLDVQSENIEKKGFSLFRRK